MWLLLAGAVACVAAHGTPPTDGKSERSRWSFSGRLPENTIHPFPVRSKSSLHSSESPTQVDRRHLAPPLCSVRFFGRCRCEDEGCRTTLLHQIIPSIPDTACHMRTRRAIGHHIFVHCVSNAKTRAFTAMSRAHQWLSRSFHSAFPDQLSKHELAPRLVSQRLPKICWETSAWECVLGCFCLPCPRRDDQGWVSGRPPSRTALASRLPSSESKVPSATSRQRTLESSSKDTLCPSPWICSKNKRRVVMFQSHHLRTVFHTLIDNVESVLVDLHSAGGSRGLPVDAKTNRCLDFSALCNRHCS